MNWDKKSIAAMFICVLLFTAYMNYLQRKYPDYYAGKNGASKTEVQPAPAAQPGVSASSPAPGLAAPEAASSPAVLAQTNAAETTPLTPEQLRFETKTRVIEFDQNTSAIRSMRLKDYQQDLSAVKEPVEVLDSPMAVQATVQIADRLARQGFQGKRDGNKLIFSRMQGNWELTQTFTIPDDGYGLDVQLSFHNTAAEPQELTGGALVQENINRPQGGSGFFNPMGAYAARNLSLVESVNGKRTEKLVNDYCKDQGAPAFSLTNEKVDFIGIDKHYFLSLLWGKDQALSYVMDRSAPADDRICPITLMTYQSYGLVAAGGTVTMNLTGFFGPKQVDVLEAFDPALTHTLNFGWFAVLARPLLSALKGLYSVVHNYGIAIILITLALKMLFFPLTRAAAVSMKRMQKLQPEMNRIREQFKDDPQRQQREVMAFMGKNKVNPFKGCLPILPQIPVFIAFYNVLSQSIELRHAPFYGWLQDLASRDPYYVTPLLLGLCMFLQQKLTPNPGMDKNQEKIMLLMPIVFTVMMLSLPAGMVLYMMTNTLVSILQQQWLNKKLAKEFG